MTDPSNSGTTFRPTDDEIFAAVGSGKRIHQICREIGGAVGAERARITRRLKVLERAGRVTRCPRHSADNSYFWHQADGECRGCRL
ncbi:MAG: hypothetical protein J0H88_16460 [Sphingomonadales bacterium]|nr:hypothetical protein [Sphingomonadales bacterium]